MRSRMIQNKQTKNSIRRKLRSALAWILTGLGGFLILTSNFPWRIAPPVAAARAISQAGGCSQPPSGLVSWWPFDGNAKDFNVINHGTLSGNPQFGAGRVSQALSFDGVDDQVTV